MAGHSHFKNMMHRKGRADKIRSKLFTKLSREITVSAKLGTPDPEMNPRLRAAVQAASTLFPYTTLFRSSEERRIGKECIAF